ncbi:MAG: OsmC family protein [Puniceicoccaceae bacterium]
MVEIDIAYLGELRCEAVHGPSGNRMQTDAPVDNHGKGESFSPTDLCATALGTCMMTIMGIQARTAGFDITGTRAKVLKIMSTDSPRRIARLDVTMEVPVELDEKRRQQLVRAAKTCPVHFSLHPDVEIRLQFNWKDAEGTAILTEEGVIHE